MTTGLPDEAIPVLQADRQLMDWMERMRETFKGYRQDFTPRLVEHGRGPVRASVGDQIVFWIAIMGALLCFLVTLFMLADAFRRRGRNPFRSGKRLRKP